MKMHYYKDENNGVWGYSSDQVSAGFVPDFLVEITEKEADKLTSPPPQTIEQLISMSEYKKKELMSEATVLMAPLLDAVDLGISTPEEEARLKEWKIYRVMLNRVDTSTAPDIEWPVKPE